MRIRATGAPRGWSLVGWGLRGVPALGWLAPAGLASLELGGGYAFGGDLEEVGDGAGEGQFGLDGG